jgi:hypothetical protein
MGRVLAPLLLGLAYVGAARTATLTSISSRSAGSGGTVPKAERVSANQVKESPVLPFPPLGSGFRISLVPLSEGGRDPFQVPRPPRNLGHGASKNRRPVFLPPGPRGLIISQLRLEGIVTERSTHTMIAVVATNTGNRAYFLTVGEELYDGVVIGVSPAAVYFEEQAPGAGERTSRMVVKALNAVSGAAD